MKKNILITGGTGFLGSHLAIRLNQNNYQITIIGRNKDKAQPLVELGIKFIQADISDLDQLKSAFENIDIVIHCAGKVAPFGEMDEFHTINVLGSQNIIELCLENDIKKVINISTPNIYFDGTDRLNIEESEPIPKNQQSNYAISKLKADELFEIANKEKSLNVISLRPRALFGKGDLTITKRILDARFGIFCPLINNGKAIHDLTYIDNFLDVIQYLIETEKDLSGEVFNITNDEPMSLKEIFSKVYQAHGYKTIFINIPYPIAFILGSMVEGIFKICNIKKEPRFTRYLVKVFSYSQTLSVEKAKDKLEYKPKISVDEGMKLFFTK